MDDFSSNLRRYLMLIFSLCFCIESSYEAMDSISNISKEEDMEIERQLKFLNKHPVQTIVGKHGDIIDCIDIFKQPAFDHPLLKNHKFEMEPSFNQEEKTSKIGSSKASRTTWLESKLPREMCPQGTVPIRRTKKRELIFGSKYRLAKTKPNNSNILVPMSHHFVSMEPTDSKTYYGGQVTMGIHNPSVSPGQFTQAQMWIQNGPDAEKNSIEIGWAVYPELFGNNITRLFSYWTADGYQQTGCFNFLCQGFVQAHPHISFGDPLYTDKLSMLVAVNRDQNSGNWWLYIDDEAIGYWPIELFTHLAGEASLVRFGGIAGGASRSPSAPMGNGNFPSINFNVNQSGWMSDMKIYNESSGSPVLFDFYKIYKKQDTTADCYNLNYIFSNYKKVNAIKYGGPGGFNCSEYE
ncbi:hypothetical protein MKX01_041382 [Papaver californicum]|nr:hypothetical protein MKX01_041382 [Papaver californicum]